MTIDDTLITTGIDSLIKLVHERGRIEAGDAAALLGLPLEIVEDWASLLENQGIIKIEYQFTKEYLVWTEKSGKQTMELLGNIDEQVGALSYEITKLIARVKADTEDINKAKKEVSDFLMAFDKNYGEVAERIRGLKTVRNTVDEIVREPRTELENIRNEYSEMLERSEQTRSELNNLLEKLAGFEKNYEELTAINKLRDEFNQRVSQMLNRFAEQENELKEAKSKVVELKTLIQKLYKTNETIAELETMKKGLENKINKIVKKEEEIDRFIKNLKAKDVYDYLEKLNSTAQNLTGTIEGIRSQLKDIETKKDETTKLLKELKEAYRELDATEIAKLVSEVKKDVEKIDEMIARYEKVRGSVKDLAEFNKKLDKVQNEVDEQILKLDKIKSDMAISVEKLKEESEQMMKDISPVLSDYNNLKFQAKFYMSAIARVQENIKTNMDKLNRAIEESEKIVKQTIEEVDKKVNDLEKMSEKFSKMVELRDWLNETLLLINDIAKERESLLNQLTVLERKVKLLKSIKGEEQGKQLLEASNALKQVKNNVHESMKKKEKLSSMIDEMKNKDK